MSSFTTSFGLLSRAKRSVCTYRACSICVQIAPEDSPPSRLASFWKGIRATSTWIVDDELTTLCRVVGDQAAKN